mmetsp:Transcript_35753/g.105693  ORF Transcript_35753/g.105693 Transcript_35753/m.105693 type:complete len:220 (-) Transcript_35753:1732-2391(-)
MSGVRHQYNRVHLRAPRLLRGAPVSLGGAAPRSLTLASGPFGGRPSSGSARADCLSTRGEASAAAALLSCTCRSLAAPAAPASLPRLRPSTDMRRSLFSVAGTTGSARRRLLGTSWPSSLGTTPPDARSLDGSRAVRSRDWSREGMGWSRGASRSTAASGGRLRPPAACLLRSPSRARSAPRSAPRSAERSSLRRFSSRPGSSARSGSTPPPLSSSPSP